ncbi:MAG TPA: AAA family ATPase, partial [Anaerolineales bacterium]
AAQPGEILTSGRVQQSLGEQFTFEPRPPLRLKGKAEPLPVFAVTGLQRRRATRLLEPAYRLPMIGRLTELKRIAGILDLARQGKGQIVGITAEAGMGKSRLVAEAIRLAHAKGFAGYGGACESSGTHTPYLAWKAVWQAFFDVDLAAPVRRQLRNLEGEIEDRAPDRLEAMPLLAPLLDLPIEDNDFTRSLEPKDRHNALTALLEDCLKAAAKEEPVLIVLEDVHWIDALSHNLLEDLARATASSAVCFVLAYRPPETGPGQALRVEAFPDFTKIALIELAPGEAEQLIRAKLAMLFPEHSGGLPQALVKPLTDLAQGNPFYLEELLNYLHDRGISPYDKQAMTALELPSSLHTLILSRIDRLSEKQKTALKAASIIGRLFPFAWLHGYYPALGAPKTVKKDLNELARLDLTPLETPEPELTYLFKHIITHDVAYENLAYATRAQLHEQLARYLETQDTERRLDLLAFHYGRSENLPKQREYLHKAGDAAQEAYANDAAVNYYERLLDLLPLGDREWMEISLALGRVLQRIGQGTSAENRFRQALAQARQRQDQSMIAQCEVAFAELMIDRDQNTDALIALDQARARFSEAGDRLGLCQALALSASAHFQISKAKEENLGTARVIAEECVALARQVDSGRKLLARALGTLAGIAFLQDEDALKQAALEECLAIRREIGDRQGIAFSLYNLGFYAYRLGDYERTRPVAEESLALFYQLGDKYGAIWPRGFLGWLAIIRGDYSAAHSYFKENFTFISEQGSRGRIMAASLKGMGVVAYLETDFAAARDCFDQALEIYRSIGDSYQIPMVLLELALAKLEQGIISQASQHVSESLALTWQLNSLPAKVGGLIAAARLALEHGELARAARLCGAVEALTPQLKPSENFIDDVEPKAFERTIEALKQRLDPARLAEAWAQGKGMALDEAVQFAVEQGS